MPASVPLQDAWLEHLFGGSAFVQPTAWWVQLHYGLPGGYCTDSAWSAAGRKSCSSWTAVSGSSVSNARDYQARRGKIRFRRGDKKKTEFVHTLNASGLATSRLYAGMVEQYQQADGSMLVPDVLRKWVGKEVIQPI